MCRKCIKHHHTLLHLKADPKIEGTKNTSKGVTYTAPLKKSEEVLLMTCQDKVMAPDGSVMQARALLDCATLISLIEQLAKKLSLPRHQSNLKIN